jgi:hypothetical protein
MPVFYHHLRRMAKISAFDEPFRKVAVRGKSGMLCQGNRTGRGLKNIPGRAVIHDTARVFLQSVLLHVLPKSVWKAFEGFSVNPFILLLRFFRAWNALNIGLAPKAPSSAGLEGVGRKIAQGLCLRDNLPERGIYLAFQGSTIFKDTPKKIHLLEEIFIEMRKKLDCEGFLGYTSTGFESGAFPFERGMVVKTSQKGNKRKGFRFTTIKSNQGGDSE